MLCKWWLHNKTPTLVIISQPIREHPLASYPNGVGVFIAFSIQPGGIRRRVISVMRAKVYASEVTLQRSYQDVNFSPSKVDAPFCSPQVYTTRMAPWSSASVIKNRRRRKKDTLAEINKERQSTKKMCKYKYKGKGPK